MDRIVKIDRHGNSRNIGIIQKMIRCQKFWDWRKRLAYEAENKKVWRRVPCWISPVKRTVGDEEISKAFKKRRGKKKDTPGAWIKKNRGKREGRLYPGRLSEKKS